MTSSARLRGRLRAGTGGERRAASALAPGSTLAGTLVQVPLALRRRGPLHRRGQVLAPVLRRPRRGQARAMAVTQRPVTGAGLNDPSLPGRSGSRCRAGSSSARTTATSPPVPTIMADRAGSRRTVQIPGASHVVGISHPRRGHGPRTTSGSVVLVTPVASATSLSWNRPAAQTCGLGPTISALVRELPSDGSVHGVREGVDHGPSALGAVAQHGHGGACLRDVRGPE